MESLLQDVRYAWRSLRRSPGFTVAAVLTLGLALGVNTVLFSAVYGLLLKPPPFPQPEQLVRVWDAQANGPRASLSEGEALVWMADTTVVQSAAAMRRFAVNRTGGDLPERLQAMRVTPGFFRTVGLVPASGRFFEPGAEQTGAAPVAVVSHDLAQRLFGSAGAAVGQSLTLDGVSTQVQGVLPPGFRLGDSSREAQVLVPLPLAETEENRGNHYLTFIARLKPGVTPEQAQAVLGQKNADHWAPFLDPGDVAHRATAVSWHEAAVGQARPIVLALFAASAFVLLIAAANVANLMLARALGRRRESAIRGALGASRGRQLQAVLVESVLLSALGGALGLLLAAWGVGLMPRLLNLPPGAANVPELHLPVLGFSALLCVGVGLLFGLAPALELTRGPLAPVLGSEGHGVTGTRHPLRAALVVLQLALAVVLLAGTGLMVRTLSALAHVDLGFRPEGAAAIALRLPQNKYPDDASRVQAWARLEEAARALPGLQAAGLVTELHLGGSTTASSFSLDGKEDGVQRMAERRHVSPGAFAVLGVPLRQGRLLAASDREGAPRAMVVNEAFVQKYLQGRDPLGATVSFDTDDPAWQVVGVVGDVRHQELTQAPSPAMYFPWAQLAQPQGFLVVRATPVPTLAQARELVRQVDPELPVERLELLDEVVARAHNRYQTLMRLLGGLSLLALALATLGIWGVVSYGVRQRTRELSIRRALGAPDRAVVGLVVGGAARLVGVALLVGLPAAVGLALAIRSLLYGVGPTDVPTLAGVALVLGGIGLGAAWLPARRAARVDPGLALKGE